MNQFNSLVCNMPKNGKIPLTISQSFEKIASFVQPAIQNPKTLYLLSQMKTLPLRSIGPFFWKVIEAINQIMVAALLSALYSSW